MVTQLAAALTQTNAASRPFGSSPSPRPDWRTADDDARFLRYRLFLNFDAGKHDVGRLPIGQGPVMANYARVFVRKGASYLFPGPVGIAVTPPDDSTGAVAAAGRIDAALERVRRDNDLEAADLATAIDAGVLGDGAFKVTWDRRRDRGQVRIVPVDVQTLYVTPAADDVRRAQTVRHLHSVPIEHVQAMYGFIVPPQSAEIRNVEVMETCTQDLYTVSVQGMVRETYANPYGFIPYLIFPNTQQPHQFWGLSDLVDIVDVNRALDRRLSVLAALLEVSGNPVAVLENVTGQSGVSVAPGAIWEIPQDAKAYLLELLGQQTVDQHLRYIEALYRIMDDLAEMPRMAWGEAGQARSGVALQVQLQPIVQTTQRKRLIWSGVVEQRARYALRLLTQFGALDLGGYQVDDFGLRAVWTPVLPSDRQALVADEIALYQAGLHSQQTAIKSLGVDDVASEIAQIAVKD